MPYQDIVKRAFREELKKIAGELTGHTRVGRRPISAERLLERESTQTGLPEGFGVPETPAAPKEPEKLASPTTTAGKKALVAGSMLAGAGTYHVARKANDDRKLGRQIRLQQGG